MKIKFKKKAKNATPAVNIGQIYCCGGDDYYILGIVEENSYILVSLTDGRRWHNPRPLDLVIDEETKFVAENLAEFLKEYEFVE